MLIPDYWNGRSWGKQWSKYTKPDRNTVWLLLSPQADTAVSRPRGHFPQGQAHRGLGCRKGQFWHKDCPGPYWTWIGKRHSASGGFLPGTNSRNVHGTNRLQKHITIRQSSIRDQSGGPHSWAWPSSVSQCCAVAWPRDKRPTSSLWSGNTPTLWPCPSGTEPTTSTWSRVSRAKPSLINILVSLLPLHSHIRLRFFSNPSGSCWCGNSGSGRRSGGAECRFCALPVQILAEAVAGPWALVL